MSSPVEAERGALWTVWKHRGRPNAPWSLAYSGEDEVKARNIFETLAAGLVFGGIRLLDPAGRDVRGRFGRMAP